MAFGSWLGRDGTRSDDPWNQIDTSAQRMTQCRHDPEPELVGTKLHRPIKRTNTAGFVIVAAMVIIMLIFGVIALAFGSLGRVMIVQEPNVPSMEIPADGYGNIEDFFSQYFQTGTGSGVIDLERIEPDPSISMELEPNDSQGISIQDIYDKCILSIVGITTYQDEPYGWGTGVIMTENGYIITNSHVLEDSKRAVVTLCDDREYPAKLVGYDSFTDIAVIKIECDGLIPARFGDSDSLRVGDDVVAIGNPLGVELMGTMTNGIVSAINREMTMDGHPTTLIQTNAQLNGGNSGGALINNQGHVVGITNMKMMAFGSTYEGLGFAIPTSTVKTVVDEILRIGYVEGRPGIGITVGGISASEQNGISSPAGVYVGEVTPNSGADVAGVKSGDIITHADGVEIYSTADLNAVKSDKGVGDFIHFMIWRDGEYLELDVEIMDMNTLFN